MRRYTFSEAELEQAAREVYEAMAGSLSDIGHDTLGVPEGFKERILQLAARHSEERAQEKRQRRKRAFLRAAAVFIAFLAGISAFFAVNTEARAAVREWVREIYESHIVYRFHGAPVGDTLPDYEPKWLPEGYSEIDRMPEAQGRAILYANDNTGEVIVFRYNYYEDDLMTVAPDGAGEYVCEKVPVNNFSADFYYESNPTSFKMLIWIDDKQQLVFQISCLLMKEDFLNMAESIYW